MARQPRKMKFSLLRILRRVLAIVVLVVLVVLAWKHSQTGHLVLAAVGVDSSQSAAAAGAAASTGDGSHYLLPDDTAANTDEMLSIIPDMFIGVEKCPACFGLDICDEIKNGFVRVSFPEAPSPYAQRGILYGKWHEKPIVVRKFGIEGDRFRQFEQFICENVTRSRSCPVADAIVKSYAVKLASFTQESLHGAYRVAHNEPDDLQFTMCLTESLIDNLRESFGLAEEWTLDKAAMLYTSIVISQEVVLLKSVSSFTKGLPFPRLIGSCGQLIVLDHQGVPLESYISATWEKRADLALQLLSIVDSFANGDVAWYIMYGDFRFENFDVTTDGRIVIINLENMSVIDKEAIAEYDENTDDEPCNEKCFQSFVADFVDVLDASHQRACARAPHVVTDAMYSMVCRHLLSDLAMHRDTDEEEVDDGAVLQPRGLLHSPPAQSQQAVSDLLRECVTEAVAGSRLQAVEDLSELLQQYTGTRKEQDQQ